MMVIKPRTLSAPSPMPTSLPPLPLNESSTRVSLKDTKDQAHKFAFKKPSVSPSSKFQFDQKTLKSSSPIPSVDQHQKITVKTTNPQFESPLNDVYQFKIDETAKLNLNL